VRLSFALNALTWALLLQSWHNKAKSQN